MSVDVGGRGATVLAHLATLVQAEINRTGAHLRLAVDGPDAAGKSTLADALTDLLYDRGFDVIRSGIDSWHHPESVRYRRGSESPEGYYEDSFDLDRLREDLLEPLASQGDVRCRLAAFDHRQDGPVDARWTVVRDRTTLIFDGVFLLRPELRSSWDFSIYLHVDPEVARERAVARDAEALGGQEAARLRYRTRYLPGQALYRSEAAPEQAADIVLDMTDPARPSILRAGRGR